MIILEGADHLGKTTFAKKLCSLLQAHPQPELGRLHHMGVPLPDHGYFERYLDKLQHGGVYDRFHLGAYAYGYCNGCHPVYGWSFEKMNAVHRFVRQQGGIVVLFITRHDSWYKRLLQDSAKKEAFKVDVIMKANLAFRTAPFLSSCHKGCANIVIDHTIVHNSLSWPTDADATYVTNLWLRKNGYTAISSV